MRREKKHNTNSVNFVKLFALFAFIRKIYVGVWGRKKQQATF